MRVFTYIDKLFFPHFGQLSKRSCDFKHSYLSQIDNQNITIYVSSLAVQTYFIFEKPSFVVHFTLDQTGVLSLGSPGVDVKKLSSHIKYIHQQILLAKFHENLTLPGGGGLIRF